MSTAVALRLVCSAGSATLTTVLSMKAMLEARIVAASTQRACDFGHGAVAGRDRITLSSQGSRTTAHILVAYHRQAIFSLTRLSDFNIRKTRRQDSSSPSSPRDESVRLADRTGI